MHANHGTTALCNVTMGSLGQQMLSPQMILIPTLLQRLTILPETLAPASASAVTVTQLADRGAFKFASSVSIRLLPLMKLMST